MLFKMIPDAYLVLAYVIILLGMLVLLIVTEPVLFGDYFAPKNINFSLDCCRLYSIPSSSLIT